MVHNKTSLGDTAIRCRFGKKKSKSGLMNLLEKKKARQSKRKREKKRRKERKGEEKGGHGHQHICGTRFPSGSAHSPPSRLPTASGALHLPLFSPNQLQLLPSFRKNKKISHITCPEQRHLTPGLSFLSFFLFPSSPQADSRRSIWGGGSSTLYPPD